MTYRYSNPVESEQPTRARTTLAALFAIVFLISGVQSQTTTAPASEPPTIVTNVDEVTLDLVVRNKKNRPVLDLKPGDITVTDNGAPVTISDLRLVSGKSEADRMVTLVFDQLDPSAARNACDIAAKVLKMVPETGFSFSVLNIDGRLKLFQGFTSDRIALGKAVAEASGKTRAPSAGNAEQEKRLIAVARTGIDPSGTSVDARQRAAARMMLAGLEESQRIVQDQHAQPALSGLLALARAQRQVAGRKVILYFAQGLQVDSRASDMLGSIVGAANRAGVSIYSIDTTALNPQVSQGLLTMTAIGNVMAARAQTPAPAQEVGRTPVAQPVPAGMLTKASDQLGRFEVGDRSGNRDPLSDLAVNTGGAYIGAEDNLRKALQRMVEDMSTYYEASYIPAIEEYDGRFRPVEVKPARKDLKIRTKAGYFALPPGSGSGMRPFEAPLMKVLSEPQLPTDVKFRAAVLRLGDLPEGNANTLGHGGAAGGA